MVHEDGFVVFLCKSMRKENEAVICIKGRTWPTLEWLQTSGCRMTWDGLYLKG